jgi:gamma-glutamylcyclotransferase (GGCT)/AIG2-like uncharacterized protein YtfP
MHQLFAYGSLICEDIMGSVAGPCESLGEASLRDHRRLEVTGEHYPGMIPAPGFSVLGRVYGGISDAGLDRLDRFEGDMYQRCEVEVELADGTRLVVFTYLIRDACRHRLASREWHLEAFLERGKRAFTASYLGFDQLPGDEDQP